MNSREAQDVTITHPRMTARNETATDAKPTLQQMSGIADMSINTLTHALGRVPAHVAPSTIALALFGKTLWAAPTNVNALIPVELPTGTVQWQYAASDSERLSSRAE
jgi:hypothetical protein